MVDFSKMLPGGASASATEPEELFTKLVRDPSLPYLRAPQAKVLSDWYESRSARDLVIKMNTGSGKTLVALLTLQSALNEEVGTAVYLCPTRQLASQVVTHASKAGIPTVQFADGKSDQIPLAFLRGQAVLVTTFDKVFNGLSVFGVAGGWRSPALPPGALVIDDAHSCLASAQNQASIRLDKAHPLYQNLLSLFKPALYDQSPGAAASLERGDSSVLMMVPYWSWRENQNGVAKLLADFTDDNELKFAWPLIRDMLINCRLILSGAGLQIAPLRLPIEKVPFLDQAERRLYFSGSVVDDSILVRDFGVSVAAATTPIVPRLPGDIGERLVLAPSLVDVSLDAEWVREVAKDLARQHNVVVLVPSRRAADAWVAGGAQVADSSNLETALNSLKSSSGNLWVFVNRYDGVDLADAECRVLIVDGLPTGEGLSKGYERQTLRGGSRLTADIAQRLEQGLGRGVRSNSDFCVCILATPDVATFAVDRQCQANLTPETAEQIKIGLDLADILLRENRDQGPAVMELIQQCLGQDRSWKEFHLKRVTSVGTGTAAGQGSALMAEAERTALLRSAGGDCLGGAEAISTAISLCGVEGPDQGWYLQTKAQIQDIVDPGAAQATQIAAYSANSRVLRPILGVSHSRIDGIELSQAHSLQSFIARFTDPRGIPVAYQEILSSLAFGVAAEQFEDALERLGVALGFKSDRPEKYTKAGPDVLWYTGENFFVIECKSEVQISRASISKTEASQLTSSMEWFRHNYPDKSASAVLIHPSQRLATDAFCPPECRVMTEASLVRLGDRVRNLAAALAQKPPDAWNVGGIVGQLKSQSLHAAAGLQEFLQKPKRN